MQRLYISSFFLAFGSLLFLPNSTQAAQIFLDTSANEHNQTDTFYVPIRIDTQGECVNTVKVEIGYNPEQLSIRDVGIGESIVTLWTQFPSIKKNEGKEIGSVVLEGGIPGGYCGRVVGDPGLTNIIAKLVVTGVPQTELGEEGLQTQIVVSPETRVYLHDGKGTEAPLTFQGVEFVLQQATTSPENIWLTDVKRDTIAPELFEITLVEGPSTGSDKSYIVFNTTDKQSGMDHFEVLETDPDRFGFLTWIAKEAYWVSATSPYTLRDQRLHSKILVKAVDKNGNERVVTYTPPMSPFVELATSDAFRVAACVFLLGALVVVLYVVRRRKKLPQKQEGNNPNNLYE